MTTIYIIRHAEAEGNLYRRVQGHFDGKITRRGRAQIEALAERFRDIHVDAVYASPLVRTHDTADAILRHDNSLVLNIEPRLIEINMGVWENNTWGDIELNDAEQYNNFSRDPDNFVVEGSERFYDLADRMEGVVKELGAKHDGQTIVLVTHGMAKRSLHCRVLGVASRDANEIPHGDNTCVSLYEYDNGVLTNKYRNDNSHLPDDISTFARQTWWKDNSMSDKSNLRFATLDMQKDSSYYLDCYADAWKGVYGSLVDFDQNAYLMQGRIHGAAGGVFSVMSVHQRIGVVELEIKGEVCHVCLCYLEEAQRGLGYGIQLIGQADKIARDNKCKKLRLNVSTKNEKAIGFYEHCGFEKVTKIDGIAATLCVMEKAI